jgi:hypothetical protein
MPDMPQQPPTIRLDTIWVAQQFERTQVTLEYLKSTMEKQAMKEEAQDQVIAGLVRDIAEVKSDVRSLRESKPVKAPAVTILIGVVAAAGFALGLLNQLYG